MNLECLKGIITDKLAIHIDLTDVNSWRNWNTGLTAFSLTKWSGAVSDNINLMDFGLTEFDNGRTNVMWDGITLMPEDVLFSMYRVGNNEVINPTSGETSGVTVTTTYDLYPISAITSGTSETYYFDLNGGYLQGFFKLNGYNYELFSSRYNNGITIESLMYLYPDSHGIFYMMGARAEDKYNPYFSGETITGVTSITGVTTSYNNYLDAFTESEVLKTGFKAFEDRKKTIHTEPAPIDNLKNNVIAFGLTQDRRIEYKYINADGLIISNSSPTRITATGFTMITIAFTPNNIFTTPLQLECAAQRMGKLIFYVNGRAVWILREFPEFYFKPFNNQKEKQVGEPYSISWGGGSFGLMHSWHYDYQTYVLYNGEDTNYIDTKFFVQGNPLPTECYPVTGDTYLAGLSLSADSSTFKVADQCDPAIEHPVTVMRIEYTGETGTTTGQTYFIKFNQPISALSNRDYVVDLSIFDGGFFKLFDISGYTIQNKISVLIYSDTVDVDIINDIEYINPVTGIALSNPEALGLHPFPDRQEYQYIYSDGIMYYGGTGLPVFDANGNIITYSDPEIEIAKKMTHSQNTIVTDQNKWNQLKSIFRTKDNSGQQFVYVGLLIETSDSFNVESPLFVNDFTYTAADILVQDERKSGLTIEQNFNSGFIGGIQKLRIYDNALTSPEILHNALIESKANPLLNMKVSKGGRIIYR